MIRFDTDTYHHIGQIVNDDGRTVLVDSDWDYPSVASTFGWWIGSVQKCRECSQVHENAVEPGGDGQPVKGLACDDHNPDLPRHLCEHDGSDGTVDCPCGLTRTEFITAAQNYLEASDGAEADDPGYFSPVE